MKDALLVLSGLIALGGYVLWAHKFEQHYESGFAPMWGLGLVGWTLLAVLAFAAFS